MTLYIVHLHSYMLICHKELCAQIFVVKPLMYCNIMQVT